MLAVSLPTPYQTAAAGGEIPMFDNVVIHYDEIGLKGNNRSQFEHLLIGNIKAKLGDYASGFVREDGQISIGLAQKDGAAVDAVRQRLSCVPGIAYFSFTRKTGRGMDEIRDVCAAMAAGRDFSTFKIDTRRHDKRLELTSVQINALVGAHILGLMPDKKVRMEGADLVIKVEITNKAAYVSADRFPGVGGFPSDPRQKVVALLSGGFDSPVAAYMMMKRGCEVLLVHFLNENRESDVVEHKVRALAERLSAFQQRTRLFIVEFGKIQSSIIMNVPAAMRMVVYRKFMLRISALIARRFKAPFLVVGDSLSQVASQTIENLQAVYEGSDKHVLSPLIGFDKKEIIAVARAIGTYDVSSGKCPDLCSYYLPKHPALRVRRAELEELETQFDVEELVREAARDARVIEF